MTGDSGASDSDASTDFSFEERVLRQLSKLEQGQFDLQQGIAKQGRDLGQQLKHQDIKLKEIEQRLTALESKPQSNVLAGLGVSRQFRELSEKLDSITDRLDRTEMRSAIALESSRRDYGIGRYSELPGLRRGQTYVTFEGHSGPRFKRHSWYGRFER